jgi:hypothetical protein
LGALAISINICKARSTLRLASGFDARPLLLALAGLCDLDPGRAAEDIRLANTGSPCNVAVLHSRLAYRQNLARQYIPHEAAHNE